ncbi:MAG: radical SAM protein [Melioribacteraceae bacterium]|nr:radical SAM protein [Melioribacteraceae bacterium]
MENYSISNRELYRLPWSLSDNAISWLEPTAMCNLACDGCYRENEKDSHLPLEEVKHHLDIFEKYRNTDCISIAGGDPLLYPDIVETVAEIKKRGLKPIINTNGKALTMELLKKLKAAGVYGFTFHIDSKQGRGGEWSGKNEAELNELRLIYAKMLVEVGGISCSFNSTVYEDNLKYVPEMVAWAHEHIDIVHTMVFIAFRHVIPDMPFNWYAGDKKVEWDKIMYHSDSKRDVEIQSTDVVAKIRERFPEFTPAAYLNGTVRPDTFKWLLAERVGTKKKIFGYLGPKFIELMMTFNHLIKGTYLSYASPSLTGKGRLTMMLLWPFDKGLRKASWQFIKNPLNLFRKSYLQSIMFIQPVDFSEKGDMNMCDGCPDMTVYNDQLVWSCRMEELKQYGTWLRPVPKNDNVQVEVK